MMKIVLITQLILIVSVDSGSSDDSDSSDDEAEEQSSKTGLKMSSLVKIDIVPNATVNTLDKPFWSGVQSSHWHLGITSKAN